MLIKSLTHVCLFFKLNSTLKNKILMFSFVRSYFLTLPFLSPNLIFYLHHLLYDSIKEQYWQVLHLLRLQAEHLLRSNSCHRPVYHHSKMQSHLHKMRNHRHSHSHRYCSHLLNWWLPLHQRVQRVCSILLIGKQWLRYWDGK